MLSDYATWALGALYNTGLDGLLFTCISESYEKVGDIEDMYSAIIETMERGSNAVVRVSYYPSIGRVEWSGLWSGGRRPSVGLPGEVLLAEYYYGRKVLKGDENMEEVMWHGRSISDTGPAVEVPYFAWKMDYRKNMRKDKVRSLQEEEIKDHIAVQIREVAERLTSEKYWQINEGYIRCGRYLDFGDGRLYNVSNADWLGYEEINKVGGPAKTLPVLNITTPLGDILFTYVVDMDYAVLPDRFCYIRVLPPPMSNEEVKAIVLDLLRSA